MKDKEKIRAYLIAEQFGECEQILKGKYSDIYSEKEISKLFSIFKFLYVLKTADSAKALECALDNLIAYKGQTASMLDENGIPTQTPIETIISLLCYENPEKSAIKHLLQRSQLERFADLLCKQIMHSMNILKDNGSALEVIMKQLLYCKKMHLDATKGIGLSFDINLKS